MLKMSCFFFLFFSLYSYCLLPLSIPVSARVILLPKQSLDGSTSKIILSQQSLTCDLVALKACPASRIHEIRQAYAFGGSVSCSFVCNYLCPLVQLNPPSCIPKSLCSHGSIEEQSVSLVRCMFPSFPGLAVNRFQT